VRRAGCGSVSDVILRWPGCGVRDAGQFDNLRFVGHVRAARRPSWPRPGTATSGMMFTFMHWPPLAWIAFASLVLTRLVGLGWLIRYRQATDRQVSPTW
jgi:hypothetical protein